MQKTLCLPALVGTAIALAGPAAAADYADPTWPCIQRKVEHLSVALMWSHPIPETAPDGALAGEIGNLAGELALRRVEVEDLRPRVEAFATENAGDPDILGRVFQTVFDRLDTRRTRIMRGIGDFSESQIALSEQIDATRLEMDTLMKADAPDFDKVDALEEKLDWDQVIYSDRQKSITYLCETPQLLERRLFAIAQLLAGYVTEPG